MEYNRITKQQKIETSRNSERLQENEAKRKESLEKQKKSLEEQREATDKSEHKIESMLAIPLLSPQQHTTFSQKFSHLQQQAKNAYADAKFTIKSYESGRVSIKNIGIDKVRQTQLDMLKLE